MTDKDKEAADKKTREEHADREAKAAADKRAHHDNPAQDPNHPMNKTSGRPANAPPFGQIEGAVYSRENLMTEQEKGPLDPVTPSETSPGPVETIEDLGIGPRTPYPDGDPPQPSEVTIVGQGIKGVTDRPVLKPGEKPPVRKEPAHTREPAR